NSAFAPSSEKGLVLGDRLPCGFNLINSSCLRAMIAPTKTCIAPCSTENKSNKLSLARIRSKRFSTLSAKP
ncbi:hypothetical protein D030_4867B, partial [Vibrio parahaemolyticus AQ3810]